MHVRACVYQGGDNTVLYQRMICLNDPNHDVRSSLSDSSDLQGSTETLLKFVSAMAGSSASLGASVDRTRGIN